MYNVLQSFESQKKRGFRGAFWAIFPIDFQNVKKVKFV